MELIETLKNLIEGDVVYDDATLKTHSVDTSIFQIYPQCVVYPKHVRDIQALVRFADAHPDMLSLTARSAGTDMTGGPLTHSVVVNFTKYFNHIKEVGEGYAVTEPGVYYRDFEKETLQKGYILPSYTASRDLNTVGGMVANNSAGEKSLTYGKTDRYVRKLKVVLRDGNEYEIKKLTRIEFEFKKTLNTFEGEWYRDISHVITEHHGTIESKRPIVSKNSAGYALWDIWDIYNDTYDFTRLFVGSQGTLGLITEITFDLIKPKTHARMLVLFLRRRHMKILGTIINNVLAEKPESFESYDNHTFMVMLKIFPSLLKRLKKSPFALFRDFWPEIKLILTGGIPKLVLMAEFTGDSEEEVTQAVTHAEKLIRTRFNITTHYTRTKEEGDKFWIIRRESFNILREHVHKKHTAPFIDDISVHPNFLPEFLPKLYSVMNTYNLTYTIAGHIGDGNFHIIPLMDYNNPDFVRIIDELSQKVYALVIEYKGSITGEHNDGLIRTPYLEQMFGEDMIYLFTRVKDICDPRRIFNPHKKVDADKELMIRSIKKDF
jgi:FAD/FMN-containing dehydrogenase